MLEMTLLCSFSFFAGLIDSIAGGGGLIQLPALFIIFPHIPVAPLLGTNKLSSIAGTSIASLQYAMRVDVSWKATLPATFAALVFSFLGAKTVSMLNPAVMRPVIFFLLVAIAIYTFIKKDFGTVHVPRFGHRMQFSFSVVTGVAIGFYDGFFGPGTGSFLIFVFIGIFGFSFLSASASSKVINFATNLSAVVYFMSTNNIIYRLAIPMAVCNMLGSLVGTRLAIFKGSRFVRVIFLIVVSMLIVKLAYDTFSL